MLSKRESLMKIELDNKEIIYLQREWNNLQSWYLAKKEIAVKENDSKKVRNVLQ